jgi:transcriptional regulator with XRE-family HTH domain
MEASRKERREHEKAEVLSRLRTFAEHSKWKKARLSRELGVSISTVERWLDGQDNILLASMFTIRRFLETHRAHLESSNPPGSLSRHRDDPDLLRGGMELGAL